jgi:Baculovirus F protein
MKHIDLRILVLVIGQLVYHLHTHHIIFENIGQLASAVTYLHAKITINFTAIEDQHLLYNGMLFELLRLNQEAGMINATRRQYPNLTKAHPMEVIFFQQIWLEDNIRVRNILLRNIQHSQWVTKDLDALRKSLPSPPPEDDYMLADEGNKTNPLSGLKYVPNIVRAKQIVDHLPFTKRVRMMRQRKVRFPALAFGALGTLFGLYNTHRIHQLSADLDNVKDSHNQLVEVVDEHDKKIQQLNGSLHSLLEYFAITAKQHPSYVDQWCRDMERDLYAQTQKVVHAVQAAQNHRLSVDILTSDQLDRLFKKLTGVAKKLNNQLLITQPSDLFQLEVSYLTDGQDVQLLVHVPSVPKEGLLDLFQLHPFPLPLDGNYSLIPVVENNVLGLTTDYRKFHIQLSTTTLMGCQKVSTVYICERHGVLLRDLNATCVGALYQQDFEAAQKLCTIKVTDTKEIVFQLLGNWFLIYSPVVFTSDVYCANSTRSRFFIPQGISKHHLSPGCSADFKDHVMFANTAIRIDTDIIHFEWQWENKFFETYNPQELLDSVLSFQQEGNSAPTLNDLNHIKVNKKSGFNYLYHIIGFILSTLATAIATILILFLLFRYRLKIMDSYIKCCACVKPKDKTVDPIQPEDMPLQEIHALPRYTSSYRSASNLYPSPD